MYFSPDLLSLPVQQCQKVSSLLRSQADSILPNNEVSQRCCWDVMPRHVPEERGTQVLKLFIKQGWTNFP